MMKMYVSKILYLAKNDVLLFENIYTVTWYWKSNYIKCSIFVSKAHIVLAEPLLECDELIVFVRRYSRGIDSMTNLSRNDRHRTATIP